MSDDCDDIDSAVDTIDRMLDICIVRESFKGHDEIVEFLRARQHLLFDWNMARKYGGLESDEVLSSLKDRYRKLYQWCQALFPKNDDQDDQET